VGVFSAALHPLELTIANEAILYTGLGEAVVGVGVAAGACADFPADLVTCAPGFAAGVGVAAQGGATVYGSYLFFRQVTVPAFETWGQP
jgi:hypothetical protein